MLKKNKKITLLLSGLSGVLLASSAAGVALASCSTTSSSSSSSADVQYSYVIDWNNKDAVERLIIDDNGLVYSDNAMTTIIAVSPKVKLTTIKIPSRVKSIAGYSKVMYKSNSNSNTIVDQIPSGESASNYTKVYKSFGAFQDMESLETVALESGSQLQSIGGSAFYGCTTLKSISGLSNSLNYVGPLAFTNCSNLEAIDLSNVINIGAGAFYGCVDLTSIDLSNAIYIGDYAFQNCSGLTKIGSLKQARTLGLSTFQGAFASGSNITLELNNLLNVRASAFQDAQGITKVDFSGNTLLTEIDYGAFMGSSITSVDLTGCSSLTKIVERAFKNCTNLTTVNLPANDASSLTTIGSNAFANCSNLATVAPISASKTGFVSTSKITTLGANFLANTAVTSVDLTNFNVNTSTTAPLGSQSSLAFITNLNSVTLPSTLTKLSAGLFYKSGIGTTGGFALVLPSAITSIEYSASLNIADPTSTTATDTNITVQYATPFTESGVTSVDMSKITSYQVGNKTSIPRYLFNGNTKLKSVVLKAGTTQIETYAFASTTALTSITYPASSETTPSVAADTTDGFVASSALTTIGANAFYKAFSADATNITVDLSAMTFTGAPNAFNSSNVTNLVLPASVTTIPASAFDNMAKLSSVNFTNLTKLTRISAPNFNNTQLTSIDLSKIENATNLFYGTSSSSKLFNGLPTTCVVSLPSTIGNFSDVFKDTANAYVTFSYPNGISSSIITTTDGVLGFQDIGNKALITNVDTLDLSSQTAITSIGPNTFFGHSKLTTLTLPASGISSKNIFTATNGITANASNTSDASTVYTKTNVPFGANEVFKKLNYTAFTKKAASATEIAAADTTAQTSLFSTTNTDTWTEVVKIINSLSYQESASSKEVAAKSKANMSTWTATAGNGPMSTDATVTLTDNTKIVLKNSYANATATSTTDITINAGDASATFVHNGILWTYANDGNNITLTGSVNMYKATDTATTPKSYLVFFNQSTYTETGSTDVYYVPSKTPVNVTLTIATKAVSN